MATKRTNPIPEAEKKKKGRPRVKIDLKLAEKLGSIMCTIDECAAVMGINPSTLAMRSDFLNAYKKGNESGKAKLRRLQWQGAEAGNPTMLIWMGKQFLNQKDNKAIEIEFNKNSTAPMDKLLGTEEGK